MDYLHIYINICGFHLNRSNNNSWFISVLGLVLNLCLCSNYFRSFIIVSICNQSFSVNSFVFDYLFLIFGLFPPCSSCLYIHSHGSLSLFSHPFCIQVPLFSLILAGFLPYSAVCSFVYYSFYPNLTTVLLYFACILVYYIRDHDQCFFNSFYIIYF